MGTGIHNEEGLAAFLSNSAVLKVRQQHAYAAATGPRIERQRLKANSSLERPWFAAPHALSVG